MAHVDSGAPDDRDDSIPVFARSDKFCTPSQHSADSDLRETSLKAWPFSFRHYRDKCCTVDRAD
jgi:hypothetical protein